MCPNKVQHCSAVIPALERLREGQPGLYIIRPHGEREGGRERSLNQAACPAVTVFSES